MASDRFPVYLAGPTGSGKTAIALALAKELGPTEIINADAFQIYRGMEILSAAPTEEEMSEVPHHLFGILDPSSSCDAAQFAAFAKETIEEVRARATPLVVGGSGLYLKSITHGLADTPKANPELRAQLDTLPLDELVSRYKKLDPKGALETNLRNRRYVTRNLEICLLTGDPASEVKKQWQVDSPNLCAFFLKRDREEVYDLINRRTPEMFAAGIVAEVARLPSLSQTAAKAIGVREIQALIAGEIKEEACIEAIQQATRRYSKRQETWFKREPLFTPISLSPEESPATVAKRLLPLIKAFS